MAATNLDFENSQGLFNWVYNEEACLLSQRLFIFSPHVETSLYSGVGSGKTAAFVVKAILQAALKPNNLGLIGRDTETNLIDSTMKDFFAICPPDLLLPGTRQGRNGRAVIKTAGDKPSEIIFRYFQQSSDKKHLSGLNLGFYGVDQAEDITPDEWDYPQTRLRRASIEGHRRFKILNAKGHDWNWARDVSPAEDAGQFKVHKVKGYGGRNVEVTEYFPGYGRHAIKTWTHENRFLPEGFIENIEETQPREYVQRYLYSSFEEWGGKVYKDFSKVSKHTIHPFRIPDDWPCVVGIDVGGDSPWAILTLRFDPHFGDCFVTNEYYKPGLLVDEVVGYLSNPGRSGIPSLMPPTTRIIVDPENKPIIGELLSRGVIVEAAKKGPKLVGIMRVAGYLRPKTGRSKTIPRQPLPNGGFGDVIVDDAPHLWVFKNCENFRREHDEWLWERDKKTGLATNKAEDKDDHTADSLIYALKIRPEVSELPKVNPALEKLRMVHFGSYRAALIDNPNLDPNRPDPRSGLGELFTDESGFLANGERNDSIWS